MPVQPGQTLSHYRIVEKIGEGGMGAVWKAVDTTLDREVAIKILPEHFSRDPERLGRFEREAKLLASLNHRNIATIYGLDESDGVRFLVMELVEGEDLARRLARGPLPVDEAIDVCHQLARALEAAHEKGVLHRDLKPANVQVTHEGRVKVLDFGLAKAFEVESSSGDPSLSPTLTSAGTRAGVILGTAAYMSPEQARGKAMDKRTDIWSFGCVLYECLAGRSSFHGETVSDTLASILKTDPDWSALPERTPPRVRELLQRCLAKDVRNRLRDVGDARLELQRSIAGHESLTDTSGISLAGVREERRPRWSSMLTLAAAVLIGAAAGAGLWSVLSGSGPTGVLRFSMDMPKELFVGDGALLPDGSALVFVGLPRKSPDPKENLSKLYIRRFDRFLTEPVEGTDGVTLFALSPDGSGLAVVAPVSPKSTKLRLSKVSVDGSAPPQPLVEWSENWVGPLLWLSDGHLVARVLEPQALVRIPVDGSSAGTPVAILSQGFEGQFLFSSLARAALPDGVHVLGRVITYTHKYEQHVAVLNLETGEARIVVENSSFPQWSPTGHLLFTRGETLMAVPFDLGRLATTGGEVAITDGLRAVGVYADAPYDLSANGTLVHLPGGLVGDDRWLAFLDAECSIVGSWSEERRPFEAAVVVSNDGRRLAVTMVNAEGLYDIWVSDMDRPRLTQLVHERGKDCVPQLWSPDGNHLVYLCGSTEGRSLFRRRGDGTGEAELLIATESQTDFYNANTFLRDGSRFVATHWTGPEPELVLLPFAPAVDGAGSPAPLVPGANSARISPDGRWLTYQSDSSGRFEVYLRRIHSDGSLGSEIPVSTSGGVGAEWFRGKSAAPLEIRYLNDLSIFSAIVTTDPGVRISEPRPVAELSELAPKGVAFSGYLPDGRFMGILRGDDEDEPTEANLVLNWTSELEARLSSAR